MAYNWSDYPVFSGATKDDQAETISQIRSSDCQVDTTVAYSGGAGTCVRFPTGTVNAAAHLPALGITTSASFGIRLDFVSAVLNNSIWAWFGTVSVPGVYSSDPVLLSN